MSNGSWIEGHRSTKPRSKQQTAGRKNKSPKWREENNKEKGEGGGVSEERRHRCLKNSNIVRIPNMCVKGNGFATEAEKQ